MTLDELKALGNLSKEETEALAESDAFEEEEFEGPEADLSEAISILTDCETQLTRVLKRYTHRRKMSAEEFKEVKDILNDVTAFLASFQA